MCTRIIFLISVFSINFVVAQNSFPTKKELLTKWVVLVDPIADFDTISLIKPKAYKNPNYSGIEFFVGRYTGKFRLQPFRTYNAQTRRCGNYRPFHPADRIGVSQSIWEYDMNTGILTVVHPKLFRKTMFKVKRINSTELILTKI